MIGEVPYGKAIHRSVAECVQCLRGSFLRNAGAAIAAGYCEVCDRDARRRSESSRCRREVQRELAEEQLAGIVVVPGHEQSGRAIRWRGWAIHVGGQITKIGSHLAELSSSRV